MGLLTTAGARLAGLLSPAVTREVADLRLEVENAQHQVSESVAAIQQIAREDIGWQLMSNIEYNSMLTRDFIDEAIRVARVMFLTNPIICRAVMMQAYYVFGRGIEIRCDDPNQPQANETLQAFLKLNRKRLGIPGLTDMDKDKQNAGNLFIVAFSQEETGNVIIRTFDALQIKEVVCNPEDAGEPWYYKRVWNKVSFDQGSNSPNIETMTAWYPDINYQPESGYEQTWGGYPVIQSAVVLHRKVGAPTDSPFGYPETFPVFRWVTAYDDFLKAWLKKEQALARLALAVKTKGGQKAYDGIKSALQSRLSSKNRETNPAPQTGSSFIGGTNTDVSAIKTQGSNTSPEEARRIFLMIIMLFGTETMFGDSKSGSFFTSQTLDRPTELKFAHAQECWKEDLGVLCNYVLRVANKAPGGLKTPDDKLPPILVSFPPILEHDIQKQVDAIVDAVTLKGYGLSGLFDPRTVLVMLGHVLGLQKIDALADKIFPSDSYAPEEWALKTPDERAATAQSIADQGAAIAKTQAESSAVAVLATSMRRILESMPQGVAK